MLRSLSLRPFTILLAVAAFSSQAGIIRAEEKPKEPTKTKTADKTPAGLQGYYMIIAKELGLSDDQKAKLTAAMAERSEAVKKWDEANGAKVKELTAAEAKAKEAKDAEGAKKVSAEIKTLKAGRTAIEDEGKAKFHALLTPDQKTHLQGYNLYVGAMTKFSKAELTDDQKTKAKTIALETGKSVAADTDAKALAKVKNDLAARIDKEVLTDAQREVLAKLAAEKSKPKVKEPKTTEPKPDAK